MQVGSTDLQSPSKSLKNLNEHYAHWLSLKVLQFGSIEANEASTHVNFMVSRENPG